MGGEARIKPEVRSKVLLEQAKKGRAEDLAAGRARGEEVFTEGVLGRLESGRAQEIANLINQRQAQTAGLTPEEQANFRSQALGGIQRAQQRQQRQLQAQLGARGIRGGAAGGALGQLGQEGLRQQALAEQNIFTQNIDRRRQAMDALEKTIAGARAEELGRGQFNIGQQNKELQGRLATELGYGQLGVGERSAVGQQAANEAAAQRSGDKK